MAANIPRGVDSELVQSLRQLMLVMYLSCKERDTVAAVAEVNATLVSCMRLFLDSLDLDAERKREVAALIFDHMEEELGDLLDA